MNCERALSVVVTDGRGRRLRADRFRKWLKFVSPRTAYGDVTVALVCDRKMKDLNCRFRQVDRVTDVLAFSCLTMNEQSFFPLSRASGATVVGDRFLGDIVIATGVARRQARAARHSLWTEFRYLALHGLLHLLGYDHARDTGQMVRLERRLRRKGGLD